MRPAPIGSPSRAGPIASAWPRRPGPAAEVEQRLAPAPLAHQLDARGRLERADQHRLPRSHLGPADDVEHPVHAVAEVDVDAACAGRTCSRCASSAPGTRARRDRRAGRPRTRRCGRRRRRRAARSRSGRARPRGSSARTSAATSVTPESASTRERTRCAPAMSALLQTTRPKPSDGSERRAVRTRAVGDDAQLAAERVDDDDLVGEPALGADAPPERDALPERRDRRAVGERGRRGRRGDEHRRLREPRRHEQHARPCAPRPPCAARRRRRGRRRAAPAPSAARPAASRGRGCRGGRRRAARRSVSWPLVLRAIQAVTGSRRAIACTVPPVGAATSGDAPWRREVGRAHAQRRRRRPDRLGAGERVRRRAARRLRQLRDEPARAALAARPRRCRRGGRR